MAISSTNFQATHLFQAVYARLEQTKNLLATGGGTLTVVDSTIASNYQNGQFVGYTAFVARDSSGTATAPEGEFRRVSAYTNGTLTVDTAFSAAVASGDQVTIAKGNLYPLQDVKRLCNLALQHMGAVTQLGTSLTTAIGTTEYAVPIALKGLVTNVYLQTNTDTADNQWIPIWWKIIPSASGSTETLVIHEHSSGYKIGLEYNGLHAVISSFDDPISEYIPRERAVAACALEVANWKSSINADLIPKLQQEYNASMALQPIKPREVHPKFFVA